MTRRVPLLSLFVPAPAVRFGIALAICGCLGLAFFKSSVVAQSPPAVILELAAPISDHMVLQQGQVTHIWGTAEPDATVTVAFAGQSIPATADQQGNWTAELQPLKASAQPRKLTVKSGEAALTVNDILVGEVWMCSGQSNMVFTLARSGDPAVKTADYPQIRFFNTASATATTPQRDCEGRWELVTPESAGNCSAVGFHFGVKLHTELDTPIGLINTSWGGKPVEAFTRMSKLKTVPAAAPLLKEWEQKAASYDGPTAKQRYEANLEEWQAKAKRIRQQAKEKGVQPRVPRRPVEPVDPPLQPNYPSAIYNQKVAPWTQYAIAGAIWYQGEANRARAAQYEPLLTAMIEDWRELWGAPLPFYIVQLANFQAPSTEPGVPDSWAELQHSQTRVAMSMDHCGIAIANDIGNAGDIHPKNKRDVGLRLARLALSRDYDREIDPDSSPLLQSYVVSKGAIEVGFRHVGEGLKSRDGKPLQRFEIAGADRQWHWADAEIVDEDSVRVSSPKVPNPIAVRYAWAANPEGANLVNSAGLPASLFRTDRWPLSTQGQMTLGTDNTLRQMKRQGFEPLFNGQDLSGWRNPYEWGKAEVVNGEIHLTGSKKFFLVTEQEYSDFRLVAEVKLPAGKANSGIMFRCHVEPNRVYGYQAEVDGSDRCWSGGFYDEGRRSWIWPSTSGRSQPEFLKHEEESKAFFAQPEVRDALDRDGWNRYEITCRGKRIVIKVNGVETADVRDATDASGYIGLQHHGEKGQTYRFRNIFLKPLDPPGQAAEDK